MSSAVAELEAGLQAMLGLKPPGVSGSRINSLTELCVNNVQSESVLIQKLYTHFKKTPGTHKLGVLYVVDSVTRKWLDQAKAQGQAISSAAQDGTYGAGVHRVTELMPLLMNDIISTTPPELQDKIKKLVDIWEKGQTFSPALVASFREKLNSAQQSNTTNGPKSTTPPGSPPANFMASLGPGSKPPTAAPAMPNIMQALANIAKQNTAASQSNPGLGAAFPPPVAPNNHSNNLPVATSSGAALGGLASLGMPFLPTSQPPPQAPSVNAPALPFMPPNMQALSQQAAPPAGGAMGTLGALAALTGANNAAPNLNANAFAANPMQAQLTLITTLASQGVPIDKITQILSQLNTAGAPASVPPPLAAGGPMPPQFNPGGYAVPPPGRDQQSARLDDTRDRGFHDSRGSPNRSRGRSRSRSPRGWDNRDPRDSPRGGRFNSYGRNGSPARNAGRPRDGPNDAYRLRSPPGRRQESPPGREQHQEKWIEYDQSIPNGSIKVYSRTLFVGGVTCSEPELRQIFSRYGSVQTCIVNKDKRHAFVKMYQRKDAERAKQGMEESRSHDMQLRTRWGVGFGPRDCSDYQTGISIIPIQKLTEADRKWMLTAPFGGSGGRPIVSGLCVEEPDIEIGAGVSSKAISRRMQTDKGGNHGPKSSRRDDDSPGNGDGNRGGGRRWGRNKDHGRNNGNNDGGRRGSDRNNNNGNNEPEVVGLPPGFTMSRDGINFPPGFAFGAQGSA